MKKLEFTLALLVLTGFIMKIFHVVMAGTIMSLSILILSLFYYFLSFALFNNIGMKDLFNKIAYKNASTLRIMGGIFTGIAISTLLIGALFKIQHWPMADMNFMVGLVLSLIVSAIAIIRFSKSKASYYKAILIRTFLIMGFGAFFYLLSFLMR
jgi:hypothetical protein